MTRPDNALFDPRIADWLQDGPNAAPSDALGAVLAELPSAKQRHGWTPWRTPGGESPTMMVVVSTAAVVALIVVGAAVALNLGVPPPAVPGGSPSPTEPIPTPPASQAVPLTIELGPELLGPWQPTPLDLGGALVGELDAHCLAHSTFARRPSLVVVDARGEGRVRLHYADEDGSYVMCETEPIASEFMVVMSSHGQIEDGPVGYLEMRAPFLTESAYPEYPAFPDYPWVEVIGQAGAGIDQVIAEVSGQPSAVVASMGGDGWFALWFPIAESQTWRLIGLNSAGEEVAELDQPF